MLTPDEDSERSAARLAQLDALLADLTDEELAKAWARSLRALRTRGLVRTFNTPVGDYAESLACELLGLERKGFSERSIDALGADGTRYQIKGRRLTPENQSRELSAMRDIAKKPFDVLLALFFDEEMTLLEMWKVPCEVVQEARYYERTNATKFTLTKKIQQDPRVTRLQ